MGKTQAAVTVTWCDGWTMTYEDRGGHNVRIESSRGQIASTGCKSLSEAIAWAGTVMAR